MVQLVTLLHPIFRSIYAYLFPNFMLNRYGPWLDTNAVIPTGRYLREDLVNSEITYGFNISQDPGAVVGSQCPAA